MENIKNELDIINNSLNTINEQLKLIAEKGVKLELNNIYKYLYLTDSNFKYLALSPEIHIIIN